MPITRRNFAVAALGLLGTAALSHGPAAAEDWRKQYPEITLGAITAENEADRTTRFKPVREYLEKALGVKVNWRTATDYAGIIEGVKAKKIELAYFGPASYSQAYIVTGGQVEPIAERLDVDGNKGYYSVVIVKTDSPYHKIEDLKGKKFGFADPNSTSGHQAPRFFLTEQGFNPDTFFASTTFSGSHENSVIALLNGTFDGVATWWNSEKQSNPERMEAKGMIKPGQWRIIWKSPQLPSDPWAMPVWLPAQMRADVKKAMLDLPKADPKVWQILDPGSPGFAAGNQADYEAIIRMIKANQKQRRSS